MSLLSATGEFFGLDIGTVGLRAVQLKGSGQTKVLYRYGEVNADSTTLASNSKADIPKLASSLHDLLHHSGISTKNVAVNVPSNRVFTAVIDMEKMSPAELDKTMRLQADSLIPTPLADSKIDWVVLGDSPTDPKKNEILLSSVPNEFIEGRLDLLESIGLNVIAIEPDHMAVARAVIPADVKGPVMAIDIGSNASDIVVTVNGEPRLARAIPFGTQTLIRAATQALNIEVAQAQQYVFKFGLVKDKLDGQVYNSIIGAVDGLMNEIEKSIKFFVTRYTTAKVDRIIVTGGASTIPEFPLYLANRFGVNVEIGNAWRNVSYPADQQNELMTVSNHFAVAVGLAEREL